MPAFFEVIHKKIGFARIGRAKLYNTKKEFIETPQIVIPINKVLMQTFDFVKEFEDHYIYVIHSEKYLRGSFIDFKYDNSVFFYKCNGTFQKLSEILERKLNLFKTHNVIPIIPFNIPTTTINKNFAENELKHFIGECEKILNNYPELNFGLTIKLFGYFELLEPYLELIKKYDNIKILNFEDLFDNLSEFRKITRVISIIKKDLDNNLILMASGRILTRTYPILIYLGFDFIDCSYILYLSSENYYDIIDTILPIYKIKKLPCFCAACRGKLKELSLIKSSDEKIKLLCLHNLLTARAFMNKINHFLKYEDFRGFIENTIIQDTYLISMLRILDKEYFNILRYETPFYQKLNKINIIGEISYYRPDFVEFRERVLETFSPEPKTSLIILFPCSAKKPYSQSKSHKKFLKILRKFPEFPSFQEIILTSPLGAIPRQLEDVYPVVYYNIPVTGDWSSEEIEITSKMLNRLIQKFEKNIPIICHLDGKYIDIAKNALKNLENEIIFTNIVENLTSDESLKSLEELIKKYKKTDKKEDIKENTMKSLYLKTVNRKLIKIADFQFGMGIGEKLFYNGIELVNIPKSNNKRILDPKTKELIAIFNQKPAFLKLTMKGAMRIFDDLKTNYSLIFKDTKISGNNLFLQGIEKISPNLAPKKNIIIINKDKDKILGMGQLIVGTNSIINSKTGRVAEIYEKER
ncbi:MAG: DUF5591 domain-containing protein [Promethearchaeota archaeon]